MNDKGEHDGWRRSILEHFTAEDAAVSRLSVAADPDGLLGEQGLVEAIRSRGFELLGFADPVAFRYLYETQFRAFWDRGEHKPLVVVLDGEQYAVDALPYDVLQGARSESRVFAFSLGALFPRLTPSVTALLDRADFEKLFVAQERFAHESMGEKASKDFLLRHVYGVAPELVSSDSDLLRILLRQLVQGQVLPRPLGKRLVELLDLTGYWGDWPLEELVMERTKLLEFLNERWPHFLASRFAERDRTLPAPSLPGPVELPFDHDDVRVFVDGLFVDGRLAASDIVPKSAVAGTWMDLGVAGDPKVDVSARLERLLERIAEEMPQADADYAMWLTQAFLWAEAVSLRWIPSIQIPGSIERAMEELHDELEDRFGRWLLDHYSALHSLSFLPAPVMLHHVPRMMAHGFPSAGSPSAKRALLVVDGLALDQWRILRSDLEDEADVVVEDGAVFAWVPTLTSVSRQSIFSGEAPLMYAPYLGTTSREPAHWRRFWEDHGLKKGEIAYVCEKKQEDPAGFLVRVSEAAEDPMHRVLGIVVGTVDQTMHGNVMGTAGMHSAVRLWCATGQFRALIDVLHSNDYEVLLTSDHGNIAARGIGKPDVGAIADERGERVHVFRDDLTRQGVKRSHPESIAWPQIGLPEDYRALVAPGRGAFIGEGKTTVGHGGISLEEVIVPFARIDRRA